ncbi:Uncharacterised protein [Vibrio cholerae]|uniref:Uncharacterized protein n=1 Tax=Vibrio cholerae TaxID=666 RepID=A0A655R0M3_VIBCL|nr:Uncharacterised protein [Vibrio cholerae]CSB08717.1 Uncharacterised protein [Vibrio cholerae]CSB33518.1 Uncharacterised protein [Vibrio cholerae]
MVKPWFPLVIRSGFHKLSSTTQKTYSHTHSKIPMGSPSGLKMKMAIPRNSVGSSCVIMFPSFNSGWHKMALERVMSWLAIFPTYPKP